MCREKSWSRNSKKNFEEKIPQKNSGVMSHIDARRSEFPQHASKLSYEQQEHCQYVYTYTCILF